jgi:hypothetical protein
MRKKRVPIFIPVPKTRDRMHAVLEAIQSNAVLLAPAFAQQEATKNQTREKAREYQAARRKTDSAFVILSNLRSRVAAAFKSQVAKKNWTTKQLLGCSIPEFRHHIANQFQLGMCWENHGEWELDHIKPCRAFDLRDWEQQKACFHHLNIQPLWKGENRAKNDSLPCGTRARNIKHL